MLHGTSSFVLSFIAFEPSPSARLFNGRSPLPHSSTSRWPQEPLVACVRNGSECQAVARTSEAHPLTYPTTPNSRNNIPYTTYSRSPLPTAYHHRRAWTCALGGRPVAAVGHGHLQKRPGLAPSRGPCWLSPGRLNVRNVRCRPMRRLERPMRRPAIRPEQIVRNVRNV